MGASRRLLRRLTLRQWLLAIVATIAAVAAIVSYEAGALASLERSSVDTRFSIRGSEGPGNGIVLVGLDGRTLNVLNLPAPIPRHYYARLLDRLRADGAAHIALDVQFLGAKDTADDNALLAAIARDGPIVLSTHDSESGAIPVPAGVKNARGAIPASAAVDTDSDGIIRRMLYAPVQLPTFAVLVAQRLLRHPVSESSFPSNHAWIDFRGPPGTFPEYSLVDVISGHVPAATFAGKTVLVGVTDPAEKDIFGTAASSVPMSGVEVQANALSTILGGFPRAPIAGWLVIVILLAMAVIPAALSLRLAALYVLGAAIVLLVLFGVASQLAFNAGPIVPIPDPILALLVSTVGSIAADAFVGRRQLRRLQRAFDLLPSPVSDFFISYRRNQSAFVAGILRQELVRKFGESSVFMDRTGIEAGTEWPQRLKEAVEGCRAMLVVIGPGWLEVRSGDGKRRLDDPDDWVRQEIEEGLRHHRVAVVPVLHDGAHVPDEDELPESLKPLARRNAISLAGDDVPNEIDALVASIEQGQLREYVGSSTAIPAIGR